MFVTSKSRTKFVRFVQGWVEQAESLMNKFKEI